MKSFTISAVQLFRASKPLFYTLISDCVMGLYAGDKTRLQFNLRTAAAEKGKQARVELVAHVIVFGSEDDKRRLSEWLREYFSAQMQGDSFGIYAAEDGGFTACSSLERAIKKICKEKKIDETCIRIQ